MNGTQPSNTYHSVFMWTDDGKVYLVATDNEEFHDVDIFDITNPRAPKPVAEYDLLESFPQISQTAEHPRLSEIFNHDMVVKVVNGRDVLLDAYWDGGYVMVDVENPAKATYIGDTDFADEDPLVPGISPPEGNAHEAEFSHDSTYFLGADEDFNPYRSDKFFVGDLERPAVEVGGGMSPASRPDQTLSGKVVYGGYGCPLDPTVLPLASDYTAAELGLLEGDEKILLMQRGPSGDPSADYNGNGDLTDDACFPGEKAAKAFDAGWDAIVLVDRHFGVDDSTGVPFCGSGAYDPAKPMVTVCTTHSAYHELFGTTPEFTIPYSPGDAPAIGAISVGAGARDLDLRRLGLPEPVPSRAGQGRAGRLLRDPRGARPGVRVRVRRPLYPRDRHGPGPEPRLQLVLRGRHASVPLRGRRHRGDRSLHRRRGEQLLGRRDVRARQQRGRQPGGEAPVRGFRPRPRHLHLPLHRRLAGQLAESETRGGPGGPPLALALKVAHRKRARERRNEG